MPSLWLPPERYPDVPLFSAARQLLETLGQEKVSLGSIHWRELECIVAELLRARGLDVSLTPRSKDGGRDVIARGELIPGEPTTLAVEVKHKQHVGVEDVRAALRANRDFPVVLMVTSGKFTAGVIQEQSATDTKFRVLLKDGVALTQWIREYHGGHRSRRRSDED